jgi:hypothetical protein
MKLKMDLPLSSVLSVKLIASTNSSDTPHTAMTDHVPNDLSHLSNAEFHSLCPQGEHAPGPEPLSPAAQAVLDAAFVPWETIDTPQSIAAAVLRAAAAIPSASAPVPFTYKLLAIADELEGHG